MYKSKIENELRTAVRKLGFIVPGDLGVSVPERSQFGDYSTNIALQVSKQEHRNGYQNPREIANSIIETLGHPKFLERIEAAGPGFINFYLKDEELMKVLVESEEPEESEDDQKKTIIVEYCDPNTHKMLHIGHLLQLTLGEAMARMYEYQGNEVYRTNYGSDIGPTVAKCLWSLQHGLRDKYLEARGENLRQKAELLGEAYSFGHAEYEKSLEAKEEIDQITNKLYQRDSKIMPLWDETKEWSLGYFEVIYSIFGTLFDKRINESEVDEVGKEVVLENVGKVFVKDQGAIIFPGEKHNLHNRVFINSKGNPTYEGKEVGLAEKYIEMYQFDELNIFSHKEQDDYFKVVIAANAIIHPQLKGRINHVSYGEVRLPSGKMSSREGNIVSAEDILEEVKGKIAQVSKESEGSKGAQVGGRDAKMQSGRELDDLNVQRLAVGAIKFAFLKYSIGSDLVYDLEESVSIHGDTGPYVMYVYARIQSILRKVSKESEESKGSKDGDRARGFEAGEEEDGAQEVGIAQKVGISRKDSEGLGNRKVGMSDDQRSSDKSGSLKIRSLSHSEFSEDLEPEEREILRLLEYFEGMVQKATDSFAPNEIVKYLLSVTKAFNGFYEKHHILGSKRVEFRLMLVRRVAEKIKLGLYLLGIETVDKM